MTMCLLNRSSSIKVVNNKLPWFLLFRFIDKTIDSKVDPARKLLISSFSNKTQKIANPQILIKRLHKFHAKLWRTLQNNSVITLGRRQHFSSINFTWTVVLHSISNFWAHNLKGALISLFKCWFQYEVSHFSMYHYLWFYFQKYTWPIFIKSPFLKDHCPFKVKTAKVLPSTYFNESHNCHESGSAMIFARK